MAEQDAARETARKRYPDYEDSNAPFVENKIDKVVEEEEMKSPETSSMKIWTHRR